VPASTALKGFGFGVFLAVWVIYLQQRGLSLSRAALIDATFFVAAALAEIPTGIVADKFGRKTSMTAGATMLSLQSLTFTIVAAMCQPILGAIADHWGLPSAYVAWSPITILANPAPPRFAYEVALEDLAQQQNVPTAGFAAKWLEYRANTLHLSGTAWPVRVIVVPLLLGSLAIGGTTWLLSQRRKASRVRRSATLQRA
jgi:MFS family permease